PPGAEPPSRVIPGSEAYTGSGAPRPSHGSGVLRVGKIPTCQHQCHGSLIDCPSIQLKLNRWAFDRSQLNEAVPYEIAKSTAYPRVWFDPTSGDATGPRPDVRPHVAP